MATVLIVSCSNDIHSNEIELKLHASGAQVIRLNTDQFVESSCELSFGDNPEKATIIVQDERWRLSDITSVWYRRPELVRTGVENPSQRLFAEQELSELIRQVYFLTDHAYWVSKYQALDAARRKVPQLHLAKQLGMRVPRTVVTNSPAEVREFAESCARPIIYKTLHAPVIKPGARPELWGVPTTILKPEQLDRIELIRRTGGIFQEYIEKQYEIRVTIIGEELFAAKIDSQSDKSGKIDWRDAVAFGQVSVSPYELPASVAQQCRDVVADYDLAFGAIDLIRTPDGEYIFLELNCNGQWLWVEEQTGQPLSDAMVKCLTRS